MNECLSFFNINSWNKLFVLLFVLLELSYQVELLVHAHYCFTITCDMENIACVLRTAQSCTKRLAKRNRYNLMVRLLTGIGRFREMFYVIEALYNQHHFEVLCRKGKGNVKVRSRCCRFV